VLRFIIWNKHYGEFIRSSRPLEEWLNYLTGQQVIEKKQYNQKLDKDVTLGKHSKSIDKKKISIEDADYEK